MRDSPCSSFLADGENNTGTRRDMCGSMIPLPSPFVHVFAQDKCAQNELCQGFDFIDLGGSSPPVCRYMQNIDR